MTITEQSLIEKIDRARVKYMSYVHSDPAKAYEASQVVKAGQKELAEFLSQGAKLCKSCQVFPHGMLKRPAFLEKDGTEIPPKYEVGCTKCPAYARGSTPQQAVEKWNSSEWV